MIIVGVALGLVIVLVTPDSAHAWGPITHVALGIQVIASGIAPFDSLHSVLQAAPEIFLYGSLAPDIVQGRRLQSRLRRHSHNWSTGLELLESAGGGPCRAFCSGDAAD